MGGVGWLPTVWARTVSQLVGFKAVDHHVLLRKELVELDLVLLFDEREALSEQTVKSEVGSLLCAALDEHRAKLCLLPRSDLQLGQLVRALVHLRRRHDREVDGAAQVDEVLLRHVRDELAPAEALLRVRV